MRLNRPVRRRGVMNLTPLIDVVFLLLVFFMLASTFLKFGSVPLETAGGGAGKALDRDKVALIHVGTGNAYRVDGRPVQRGEVADVLAELTGKGKTEAIVVVREGARTMDLAAALALIRRQDFSSVRVVE
jgi:biopolymer transport protein ExbD